jgi:hypothetical protein
MVEVNIDDGPCGWIIDPAVTGCCTDWADYPPEVQERAAILAATWMWAATGRLYGQCETTIRTCGQRERLGTYRAYPVGPFGSSAWQPYLAGGVWWNAPTGAGACCASKCELTLPGFVANTAAVTAVTIGDTELEPGDWQVYDHDTLVRTDGLCWPVCCNATGDGAVEITYGRGRLIPADVLIAADVMACEFAAACTPGKDCRLPRQVASMSQMGVTIDFATLPDAGTPIMRIGIDEVDQVVAARNPWGMAAAPTLSNPNRPIGRQPM